MKVKHNSLSLIFFFSIITLVFTLRLMVNHYLNLPLHFDEAQYWSWSQKIAWGYFSKPPFLAWIIKLTTIIFGNSEFSIRIISPLLHTFSAIIISYSVYCITKNIDRSLFGGIIYLLMPGVTFSSLMVSTDVPLIFFSSLISLITIKLYQNKDSNNFFYFLFSVVFALLLLSKYAALYLIFSYLITIIFFKDIKTIFINKKFFLSILGILIFISPHIIWNIDNDFVTFSHTASNANFNGFQIDLIQGLVFILSQLLIFGLIPIYIIITKIKKLKSISTIEKFNLINFIIPLIIIFCLAIVSRANANWAVIGYPFGCIFLASTFFKKDKIIKNLCLINQLVFSSILILILIINSPNFFDPFYKLKHVKNLAEELKLAINTTDKAGFIADDREDYAHMLYYLKDLDIPKAKWNGDRKIDDHYELTTDVNNLKGKNVLLLTRTKPTADMINRSESYEKIKSININYKNKNRTFNIFLMHNWN